MANSAVSLAIDAVRTAVYGRDVREAIASALENTYTDVEHEAERIDEVVEHLSNDILYTTDVASVATTKSFIGIT